MFTQQKISKDIYLYECKEIPLIKGFTLLQQQNDFKESFINILRTFKKFKYYFIEFPSCSFFSHNICFQFVIINADHTSLKTHVADFSDFQEYHTKKNEYIIQFPSLSKDSLLIVPVPLKGINIENYSSISPFMKFANKKQIYEIWTKVSQALIRSLQTDKNKSFWLSTSGLAVPWLHIRIDTKPKYYHYQPFKRLV